MTVEAEILLAIIRDDKDEAERLIDTLSPSEVEGLMKHVSRMGQLLYSESRQLKRISFENNDTHK